MKLEIFILILGLLALVFGVRWQSRQPHHVVSRIGGRVVADYWTTNNIQKSFQEYDMVTGTFIWKTNLLWKRW